ncbi:Aste57867_18898 [Aphanomyces stellatus]|uniref:Aste57867_18898 protein n=1 Tax=Aphanomyces stellatus TaxID=120398 RepID=A0A485LB93_9STRA|nr:hypothetical protein As57867_018834 [Aphanomyces stellatus]VFT95630.1 Aste57867_18898 [Aphanomyces stellatus]
MSAWQDALLPYLRRPAENADVVYFDETVVVVADKYPKATCHLLVIPRGIMPIGVGDLTRDHLPLLRHMQSLVSSLSSLPLRVGFHSVPSMRQLHLHVISDDFISPALKHKKHWNSFTTAFFKPLDDVLESIVSHGHMHVDVAGAEALLTSLLTCYKCRQSFSQMPKLKRHLVDVHGAPTTVSHEAIVAHFHQRATKRPLDAAAASPSPKRRASSSALPSASPPSSSS